MDKGTGREHQSGRFFEIHHDESLQTQGSCCLVVRSCARCVSNSYKFLRILTNSYEFLQNLKNSTGRADDVDMGCEDDIWFTRSARAGENVPLRADRWFQSPPENDTSIGKVGTTHSDIRCNIWERAKVRKNITHRLSSGSQRNIGYYAWHEILHGDVCLLGTYTFSQTLPDKIARFLFEFHGKECRTLSLPNLPDDRGHIIDVHRILDIYQVQGCVKKNW